MGLSVASCPPGSPHTAPHGCILFPRLLRSPPRTPAWSTWPRRAFRPGPPACSTAQPGIPPPLALALSGFCVSPGLAPAPGHRTNLPDLRLPALSCPEPAACLVTFKLCLPLIRLSTRLSPSPWDPFTSRHPHMPTLCPLRSHAPLPSPRTDQSELEVFPETPSDSPGVGGMIPKLRTMCSGFSPLSRPHQLRGGSPLCPHDSRRAEGGRAGVADAYLSTCRRSSSCGPCGAFREAKSSRCSSTVRVSNSTSRWGHTPSSALTASSSVCRFLPLTMMVPDVGGYSPVSKDLREKARGRCGPGCPRPWARLARTPQPTCPPHGKVKARGSPAGGGVTGASRLLTTFMPWDLP